MEIFSVNLAGKVRRETLNGRSFLVAPMSLLPLNGVLHGSQGPLFYPERETRNSYKAWDYMPLVVWHPTDSQGRHVSARDPGIIQNWGIGFNRKTHINGKMLSEGWFDEEKTRQVDNKLVNRGVEPILPRLLKNKPIELSTGLFTDNEAVPEGTTHNGTPYEFTARNYRPDHIAILPDQKGACSNEQGCGVMVNGGPGSGPRPSTATKHAHQATMEADSHKLDKAKTNVDAEYTARSSTHALMASDKQQHGSAKAAHEDTAKLHTAAAARETEMGYPAAAALHTKAAELHMAAAKAHSPAVNAMPKTLLERFMDWFSVNAGKYGNPQHPETGQYMEHGAGTGKGDVHEAAKDGYGGWYGDEHPEKPLALDQQYVPGNPKPPAETHHETDLTNDEWNKMNETALKGGKAKDALEDNFAGGAGGGSSGATLGGGSGGDISTLSAHNQAPQGIPMGPPSQFNPPPVPPAHDASKQAAGASLMAEHPPAREPALAAVDHSKEGNSKKAASFHTKAAEAHEDAATDARKNKDPNTADQHDNAAALHRKAASLHQASMIGNQEQETTMPNFGTVGYSRGQALRLLTANCACEQDKLAYNRMSDDELKRLLGEIAKAPVGNAKTNVMTEEKPEQGQAVDDEGKKHKEIEDEYDEQGVKIEKKDGPKGNSRAVMNAWFNDPNVPAPVKEAARENLRAVREQKIKLVTRLITNVRPEDRQAIGNQFMQKDLSELRLLVSLIPTANEDYLDESYPVANYGLAAGGPGSYGLTENESADVLPLTAEHTGGIYRRSIRNKSGKDTAGQDVGGEDEEHEPEKEAM